MQELSICLKRKVQEPYRRKRRQRSDFEVLSSLSSFASVKSGFIFPVMRFELCPCGFVYRNMRLRMSLEKRRRTSGTSRALDHLPDRRCLVWAVGHDENMPRGEDRFQSHGCALCRRVMASKPF